MAISVDFHMRDDYGRVPAKVSESLAYSLEVGDLVMAEDYEGNRCKARIEEISTPQATIYLSLVPGTTDSSPMVDMAVEARRRAAEGDEDVPEEFQRFEALARTVVNVPKEEIKTK